MENSPVIIRIKKMAEENNKMSSKTKEKYDKKVIFNTKKEAKNLQKNQSKYRRIKKVAATITTHNDKKNLNKITSKDTNRDTMEYCTNCHKIFSSVRALKNHIFIANLTSSICHKKSSFNPVKKIQNNNFKKVTAKKDVPKVKKKDLKNVTPKKEKSNGSTKIDMTLEHKKQFEIISVTFLCEKCDQVSFHF